MFEKLLDTNFTSVSVRRGTEKQMSVPARTCLFQNYAGVSNLLGCFKIMRVFQTCEGVSNLRMFQIAKALPVVFLEPLENFPSHLSKT